MVRAQAVMGVGNHAGSAPTGRRDAIREEAARVFARRGYHGAALQEIADAIGFTKASIYYYYRAKEELLFDILSFADTEISIILEREIGRSTDALDRVGRIVAGHVHWYLDHPDIARVAFRDWAELKGEALEVQIERRRHLSHLLRDSIEACREAGITPQSANVTLIANFINGAVAATNVWFSPEGPDQPESVAAAFGEMAKAIVRSGGAPEAK